MAETILVLNAGSSSIKFQLFETDAKDKLIRRIKGQIEGIGTHPRLQARTGKGDVLVDESWPADAVADAPAALDKTLSWFQKQLDGNLPSFIGHRVAHGGPDYNGPVIIDDAVLTRLERLTPLVPLHQPHNLAPIRVIRSRRPEILQVACFDTAFHHGHAETAQRFAIPDALHREGVRRYGFHGLSYEYIAQELPRIAPIIAGGRIVVAHLGSGASMCALHAGRSIDSTMSFTALDGLPMGTRCGQIDPGVLLYLLKAKGWDAARLERFLYYECGLKGLSGVSNDMRDLLASKEPLAALAVDYFVYRILRETGALAASMGGIDGFVFTGGIGEKAALIRSRVGQGLAWLGIKIDETANAQNSVRISTGDSRLSAWVIPTDEERMIALHTQQVCSMPATGFAEKKGIVSMTGLASLPFLKGKKALLTGIANDQSIAWGCAKAFRLLGADLAITYLNEKARPYVEPLAQSLEASIFMPLDVRVEGQMEAVFNKVQSTWGALDVVLHSIAFAPKEDLQGRVVDCSKEGFGLAMEVSCWSFIRMAKLAEPLMSGGGALFTMTYYGSQMVVENYNMMGPVKAALESSTRYMAAELGPKGIRVHAISPGPLKTRAASGITEFDKMLEKAQEKAPARHLVSIDDVGIAVAFLATDAAKLITGQTIYIDGGYHIID